MNGKGVVVSWLSRTSALGIIVAAVCGSALGPQVPPSPGAIQGRVTDASGSLAGARVRFQGTKTSVLTDAKGHFTLPSPSPGPKVTASKSGYLIGSAPNDATKPLSIVLSPLPKSDCERYAWVDPSPDPTKPHNCANCHEAIYREWKTSGHAHSATNRRFLDLCNGTDWQGHRNVGWNLRADRPEAAAVCTACHAPALDDFNDPAYEDLSRARGVAAQGVHCDYCHKIVAVENHKIGLTHGRFGFRLLRPAKGQLFFGPFDDVDRHEDSFIPAYRDSRYCASCHEGVVLGVHVYSTYSEWRQSPAARAGKQCQSCHMAPTGQMTNMAPAHGGIERDPKTLANHRFFNGDRLTMLRHCMHISAALERTAKGVKTRITLRADDVGHRVPTGFVDHHLVLFVEALDVANRPLTATEGPRLPTAAGKEWAGRSGQLYAKRLHDENAQAPVPFWLADPGYEDTRLRPGVDQRSDFVFPPATTHVRVRLLHRRFWPAVTHSKGWPDDTRTVFDCTWPLSPSH